MLMVANGKPLHRESPAGLSLHSCSLDVTMFCQERDTWKKDMSDLLASVMVNINVLDRCIPGCYFLQILNYYQ